MGNRCGIVMRGQKVGIYLHWNGSYDSINAFTSYMKLHEFRGGSYGMARLAQVIGNFFGGTCSIGLCSSKELARPDGLDNGVWLLDEGFNILKNINPYIKCRPEGIYDLLDAMVIIDKAQPASYQLGEEFIRAPEVMADTLKVGDKVAILGYDLDVKIATVKGFKDDYFRPISHPVLDLYDGDNPNNIYRDATIKKIG